MTGDGTRTLGWRRPARRSSGQTFRRVPEPRKSQMSFVINQATEGLMGSAQLAKA